jgi:hypothetical protein
MRNRRAAILFCSEGVEARREEDPMVHLVLTFCMMAWQTHCVEERPMLEQMSATACIVQGQQIAQRWLDDHPRWMLSGWSCEENVPRQLPS